MRAKQPLLTLDRTSLWTVLALANAIALYLLWRSGGWLHLSDGSIRIHDYLSHWAAGKRVLSGQPALVYDLVAQNAYQAKLIGAAKPVDMGFFYPPTFLLTTVPFASLPLMAAYVTFLATTVCLYALALRLVARDWSVAMLASIAGGGAYISFLYVQNGFLTAAMLTAGLALLPSRPRLAGIFLGLLTIKPQIGLLIPFALAAAGYWRTIGWAAVTAIILALVAELILGRGIWGAFIASSAQTTGFLESGSIWFKMQSPFAIGLPYLGSVWAYAVHASISIATAWAVIWVWRSSSNSHWLKGAVLIAGSLLVSPYLFAYDAVMITAAALMLVRENPRLPLPDRLALLAACLLPGLARLILSAAVPMAAAIVLVLVLREVERSKPALPSGSAPRFAT